jgi:predicted MFS family arabinose efflux permease
MGKRDGGAERRGLFLLSGSEWLVLLVLSAVQFTHVIDFMIVMPLGPRYMDEMGISPALFGLVVSAYAFSAGLSGLLAAGFIDRFDRKTALLALYAGFCLGTLLCAVAPEYLSLLLARTVTGAFGGVVGACALAVVGDAFPHERRGTAMGVLMTAFSLASIFGVPAGLWLSNRLGWRAPFGVLGVLSLAVLLLVKLVLPSFRAHLTEVRPLVARGITWAVVSRPAQRSRATTWTVLCRPAHLRAFALMISLMFSSFMIMPDLSPYLVFNVGLAETDLPYVYLCGGLATLLTLPIVGRLADCFGKLGTFRILAFLTVVPILLITNLPPVALVWALAATTLLMVVTSGRMVPAMAMITGSAAPGERGSFLSLNASVQQMAAGVASLIGGAILGKTDSGALTHFPLVGVLAVAGTLVSLALAGRLHPPQVGQPEGTGTAASATEEQSSVPLLEREHVQAS